ncbi:MAG: CPBP family intramembrane metalloprotease [Chromatiales bacterium]|nr:CPBP family intramembrane metalloprotease [Chromatiales bacterium]
MGSLPRTDWLGIGLALLLISLVAFAVATRVGHSRLDDLQYPAESLGRVLDRHLGFYESYPPLPSWEKLLHRALFGTPDAVLDESLGMADEVLAYLHGEREQAQPWTVRNILARVAVALGEAGRLMELERVLTRMDEDLEASAMADAVRQAYLYDEAVLSAAEARAGAALLPWGWASDRLRLKLTRWYADDKLASLLTDRLKENANSARHRLLLLTAILFVTAMVGLRFLHCLGSFQRDPPWQAAALAQPWSFGEGIGVTLRAAVLGVSISILLQIYAGPYFRPGFLASWSTLFASLPMLWLIQRRLLSPRGLSLADAFGLNRPLRGWKSLPAVLGVVLLLDWGGTFLISWGTWHLGWGAHWSESLHERMIFGPWDSNFFSAINLVVWAPLFEEIGFRGLLYVSLRAVMPFWSAALLSAIVFSALHLYSLPGFLSVFWSGLVMAWAFERLRSLVPGILVHAAGNGVSLAVVLLFYR